MKNIRKFIAAILCIAMMLMVCAPFASAEEPTEGMTEITQETPEPELPVEDGEKSYSEKMTASISEGMLNLERGGLTLASFLVSPLVILFPMTSAVGLILLVKGLPAGIGRVGLGIGQIVGAPFIALFK